jgi:hypothetical protein
MHDDGHDHWDLYIGLQQKTRPEHHHWVGTDTRGAGSAQASIAVIACHALTFY